MDGDAALRRVQTARNLIEKAREMGQKAGRQAIRARLAELEARFPRHRFRYIDGMGTMTLYCEPGFINRQFVDSSIDYGMSMRFERHPEFVREIVAELAEMHESLMDFAAKLGDEFRCDFGDVTTRNEDED